MKPITMKDDDDKVLDAAALSAVRRIYLPPSVANGDTTYWLSLEQRIMSRLASAGNTEVVDPQRWHSVLEDWSRAGLIAAGIALVVSAALLQNQRTEESSAIYEYISLTAVPESMVSSLDLNTQPQLSVQRDAVISYVLAR